MFIAEVEIVSMFDLNGDKHIPGAARVMQRCEQLAQYSSMSTGICRTYLTQEHQQCNATTQQWMQEAGMKSWIDGAGNCWGRYASANEDASSIILGSHLDTVPNAGKYDGILGVVAAIEVVDALHRNNVQLPFHIDVVGFGDEEGTRFGTTLLGSRAVAGQWQDSWFALQDKEGMSLSQAMESFGLKPEKVSTANRSGDKVAAYLELHIEQGPILEQEDLAVGVVTSIAGARRFNFTLEGMAGHAGTVPMNMRRDAMVTAALCIAQIEDVAKNSNVVATVGKLECSPGSVNVIAGKCQFSLDIRSGKDSDRDAAVKSIFEYIEQLCHDRDINFSYQEIHNAPAVECADWLQQLTAASIADYGLKPLSMMSGAGHDAMVFSGIYPMAMLFVRCKGGISHHPAEAITEADVAVALDVFLDMIMKFEKFYCSDS